MALKGCNVMHGIWLKLNSTEVLWCDHSKQVSGKSIKFLDCSCSDKKKGSRYIIKISWFSKTTFTHQVFLATHNFVEMVIQK